ncbi:MAG: hypothetical protein LCH81_10980 [Bacteroidetes bacterium]|nr:hypothetical protein [Bacteroidota bacterium]
MKRTLLIGIFQWLVPFLLLAQTPYWQTAVGPYGGNVAVTPTFNNKVYARFYTGIYLRSTDYGEHWAEFDLPSADPEAYSVEVTIGYSGNFYAIVLKQVGSEWVRRLYRSQNEGATWELRNESLYLLGVWESPSGVLLGYSAGSTLYRSLDGGLNWQTLGEFSNFFAYDNTFLAGADGRIAIFDVSSVRYSLDHGATWQPGGTWEFTLDNRYQLMPTGTLFRMHNAISGTDFYLYRSTDWGNNWQGIDIPFENQEYPNSILQLPSGRLLLSTNKHLYFSDDDGILWSTMNTGEEAAQYFFSSTPLPNGDLLGTYKNSIFRSNDQGENWTFSATGMQLADTKQLELLSDSLQLAVTDNGLWRTEDAGSTWARIFSYPDVSRYLFGSHPLAVVNADSFVISKGAELWRTVDGGTQFTNITPSSGLQRSYVFVNTSRQLFASTTTGIALSNDFGTSWQNIFSGKTVISLFQHPEGALFMAAAPANNTNDTRLYTSADGGLHWNELLISGFAPSFNLSDLQMGPQGDLYAIGFGQYMKLAHSADQGATWTYTPIPDIYALGPLGLNTLGHVFTPAGNYSQVFCSVDEGNSWYFLPNYNESGALLNDLKVSPSGFLYVLPNNHPVYRSTLSTQNGGYLKGRFQRDADADCSTPDAQVPLPNWVVDITGEDSYAVSTSPEGRYSFYGNPGTYTLEPRVPQKLWWTLCDSLEMVQLDSAQTIDTLDFAVSALSECPLMSVDVGMPQMRRCFDNTVYVSYCNAGSEPADSAWVDVLLDPYLSLVSSAQPHQSLGNNIWRFQLGDVDWGDCGQFSLLVHLDCDSTVLGQTHCITAHAFPDTLCNPVPEWSGANIVANATCQDTLVRLELRNTAPEQSSLLNYIIIEDDVVLLQDQKQYDGGEILHLDYPANGHTWRIESQQEPGHPFSNLALAFLEGCGGFQTLGFINRFSVDGWEPSIERECLENTGSFDPNDKQGFPLGYGDEHRIRPGQALEYMIRFQNTGTDTAFTVQIRDTLSQWLDPASVRPGASSHAYTWNLSGAGVLTFRFDNIMLPDSNVNLAGSQGFVSFRIDQQPEVPLETQILNSAAIYFDFNAPVITNQTLHTVGVDYITDVHDAGPFNPLQIGVQPNPALLETLLSLPEGTERLTLFSTLGQPLRTWRVSGPTFRMERSGLPAGVYAVRAEDGKGKVKGVGKLVWR